MKQTPKTKRIPILPHTSGRMGATARDCHIGVACCHVVVVTCVFFPKLGICVGYFGACVFFQTFFEHWCECGVSFLVSYYSKVYRHFQVLYLLNYFLKVRL